MKSYATRKIRSLMALHCITNRMIAEKAGVSETFVSYVINGKRKSNPLQKTIQSMICAKNAEL